MSTLYKQMNASRQGLHQFYKRQAVHLALGKLVLSQASLIRQDHPKMGCRTMHLLMNDIQLGRDRCEQLLLTHGFRVKRRVNYIKTTISQRELYFPDLIKGMILTGINQVWQTDITYYLSGRSVFYIIFIEDVYSRRIIGHCAHNHMRAEANLNCLKMAFNTRKNDELKGLIHHSDRGAQYIANAYLTALRNKGIQISMCKQAWQNAYTERVNGTIKNDYLYAQDIQTLAQLRKALDQTVKVYNEQKPHQNLVGKMSPFKFENYLNQSPKKTHPIVKIYDYEEI